MMSKKMLAALSLTSASVVFACSSGGGSGTTTVPSGDGGTGTTPTTSDDGAVVVIPATAGAEKNPYGVLYPSSRVGIAPRGDVSANVAGSRLQNFAFKGTLSGNPADPITRISMAQFFDPESRDHKLIFIQAAGVWCTYCHKEAASITPHIAELKANGVLWLTAIIESRQPGTPSSLVDLSTWYNQHKTPSPLFLDSGAESLGAFFSAAAMPWNAIIDARSMEILEADVGAPTDAFAHVTERSEAWTAWQNNNAPLAF